MNALLGRLDLERGGRPFFWVDFRRQPPEASHSYWDYCDIAGRFVDGLALGRILTGRRDAPEAEALLRRFLWAQQDPGDGLFYNPEPGAPDAEASKYEPDLGDRAGQRHVDLFCQRAPLLALTTLLALGDQDARPRLERMARGLRSIAEPDGDGLRFSTYRWARRLRPEWAASPNVPERWLGYRYALLTGLARYAQLSGDPAAAGLAAGLARWYMRHGDVPPDGRFKGNTHSGGILPTTVGIARLGAWLGDAGMLEWAHRVYRWVREQTPDFGFLRDGLGLDGFFAGTCETCGLADLLHLALLLTEAGAGDYRDDIERYARNQLIENQYADADALRRAFPGLAPDVLGMLHGGFECAARPNALLAFDGAEGCCIGGGLRALYLAWRASISESGGETRVELGFTRSTPRVEVVGREPWEGRIDVRLRAPGRLRIRLPEGVGLAQARARLDGRDIQPAWSGRYTDFGDLRPGQSASLAYPLRERAAAYAIDGAEYQAYWRGGTLVELNPPGERYPIYQRRGLLAAPPGEWAAYPIAEGGDYPVIW
jgi:hypothetical protein